MKSNVLNLSLRKIILLFSFVSLTTHQANAVVASLKGKPSFIPGEVLVRLKGGASASDKAKITAMGTAKTSFLPNVFKIKLTQGQDVLQMVETFKKNPAIESAQPNYLYYALGPGCTPTDTYFTSPYNWPFLKIQADKAWAMMNTWPTCPPGFGGAVTLAVLDTGVSRNHPDLDVSHVPLIGYNAITDTADNPGIASNDDFGHGTYVAGIIGASWSTSHAETGSCNNGSVLGMAGLAPNITIMAVKVLDNTGSGTSEEIIAGLNFAVTNHARVLSMSLGGPSDPLEEDAINSALSAGCVVVAAAGNESNLPNQLADLDFPAGYPGVIAVGATDQNDKVAFYSNGGSGLDGKILDLVAPGGGAIQSGNAYNDSAEDIFSSFHSALFLLEL